MSKLLKNKNTIKVKEKTMAITLKKKKGVVEVKETKKVYTFVPMQKFSEPWTDEKLYAKYGLTKEEVAFIESMIRPMDLNTNENE